MSQRLTLGHSPDSDDAFMFYALAEGLVDTQGLEFDHVLRDIQTLNEWAREGRLDCTAISVHAYPYVAERYAILGHGASMGDGYGPMVVAREPITTRELAQATIAVPGELTSAFLALGLYFAGPFRYEVMHFDRILEAVSAGRVDAGLIIHEGQLTHGEGGLVTVVDLGAWWRAETGLPLPLGVNCVRKEMPADMRQRVSQALRESIRYGLEHRSEALAHAMRYAREMTVEIADRFVGMYVNAWTLDMGERGRESIRLFLDRGAQRGLAPKAGRIEFVD
ncbi:MAG TPA: MqnA/MqnD/SBP family protein [Chthonomonadales bacterium]|nr:MqnA/MqnD/SBP family protein [Chthonomonadales bacterium]